MLHAEGVSLETLADEVGTPVYVYSTATLKRHYGLLRAAADAHRDALGEALIAFAVKANSNLSVLATLAKMGSGADTVSEGEIRRALAAGVPAERIIFSGVGKTDVELAFAIAVGVRQINIESGAELDRLIQVAALMDASPAVAVRVNPNIGAGGHAKITTGGKGDKFGVPVDEALELSARASASPHVTPVGLACHIGSQITDLAPLEAAFRVLAEMTLTLRGQGCAEVAEHDALVATGHFLGGDQEVRGLDVLVHDAAGVRVVQGPCDLGDDVQRTCGSQRPVTQRGLGVGALDVLHRDPQLAGVGLTPAEHAHDVGMLEASGDVGFVEETATQVLIVAQVRSKHLERFAARQGGALHEVDGAHRSDGQDPLHAVTGDVGGRCGRAIGCCHVEAFRADCRRLGRGFTGAAARPFAR